MTPELQNAIAEFEALLKGFYDGGTLSTPPKAYEILRSGLDTIKVQLSHADELEKLLGDARKEVESLKAMYLIAEKKTGDGVCP